MSTTFEIGTSTDLGINSHTGTLHEEITHQLGEYAGEHDIDAIEADYRDAIAAVLPRGVWLSGETLYSDRDDGLELGFIRNTLESIPASEDFRSIVEKHDFEAQRSAVRVTSPDEVNGQRWDDVPCTLTVTHGVWYVRSAAGARWDAGYATTLDVAIAQAQAQAVTSGATVTRT